MLTWIIKIIIISLCFIFLVHYLIIFLKNMLTIPKTKDLVRCSSEKYDKMCSILENNKNNNKNNNNNNEIININKESTTTDIDALPIQEDNSMNDNSMNDNSMKNELKMFLKNQLNTDIEYNFLPNEQDGLGSINYSLI